MPAPLELKVGDHVRFVSIPEAWSDKDYVIDEDSVEFMKVMIRRGRPSRIREIDDNGYPWIEARLRHSDGSIHFHFWMIDETTGWRRVVPRSRPSG